MDQAINQNLFIKEKRSALSFMSLFSEWTGINDKIIDKKCHMISNDKCENQNNVINYHNKIINYLEFPIEKTFKQGVFLFTIGT